MVEVTLWYYLKSESKMLRFSRELTLSAVPFVGAGIDLETDYLEIKHITFTDGGGVIATTSPDENSDGTELIISDEDSDDTIDEMIGHGWKLLSAVNRKRRS